METMNVSGLSSMFKVHPLHDANADEIFELCQENTLYYRYCEAEPTKEQVLHDLHVTPPGIDESRKYYVGFYRGQELIAVMDLIDGYPEEDIAFIGFFMVRATVQRHGIGSDIIGDTAEYLKKMGKTAIQLGIDKGNPQSTAFWKKNGFQVLEEVKRNGGIILLAHRTLVPAFS